MEDDIKFFTFAKVIWTNYLLVYTLKTYNLSNKSKINYTSKLSENYSSLDYKIKNISI